MDARSSRTHRANSAMAVALAARGVSAQCTSVQLAGCGRTGPSLARTGPQLRLPAGGHRQAATAELAASSEETCGTTTPRAPASSARAMSSCRLAPTRT
jgi:hypothetical protein